jgi:hypothetical protein
VTDEKEWAKEMDKEYGWMESEGEWTEGISVLANSGKDVLGALGLCKVWLYGQYLKDVSVSLKVSF